MTTKTSENKRARDYSHEYQLRQKKTKRLRVDMDRERADLLADLLAVQGLTLAEWLRRKIDQDTK